MRQAREVRCAKHKAINKTADEMVWTSRKKANGIAHQTDLNTKIKRDAIYLCHCEN